MLFCKYLPLILLLALARSATAAPLIESGDAFLVDAEHPWKRGVIVYQSEENQNARFEVAFECNSFYKSVFYDYVALRLISRSSDNPDGYIAPVVNSDMAPLEDWVKWQGVTKVYATAGASKIEVQALYVNLPYKIAGSNSSVDSHFLKLNPGPMRSRDAVIAKGSKAEIANWIVDDVKKLGNSVETGVGFDVVKSSGVPFGISFKFDDLSKDIRESVKSMCN